MRVLMVASECYPLVKTGGLADVVGALPAALAADGCASRVMLPAYPSVLARLADARPVMREDDVFGGPGTLLSARGEGGLDVLALDAPHLFARDGNPYLGPDGRDWPDNHRRYAALCAMAARYADAPPDGWAPDIVHCHDWQAGLVPVYRMRATRRPPVVFTIHNIGFPGLFPAAAVAELGLPPERFAPDGFEYYGHLSFLKAGLVFSDRLTTVSPTYARELLTPRFGMGFEGVLAARAADLTGILNGIDDATWNPAADAHLAAPYDAARLDGKAADRAALQAETGLDPDPAALLACVVSRLTDQKGLDLLAEALPVLLDGGGQLALLGSGVAEMEDAFHALAAAHPGRVSVRIGYDEALSHRLVAGADAIVVPSRFEPCGLTQLIGLRYGTIPIVARTGGLADSVIDANVAALQAGVATGFVFEPVDAEGMRHALRRALAAFADRTAWRGMIQAAMRQPVGWTRSAAQYRALYNDLAPNAKDSGP
ncbi:MAG: glycogen synthase GlgA [Proteobacteria bacterium]|nr:glycogen synthase GlgA [Pseudomonadota bacterium]